jgi:hypothetical protein
MNGDPRTEERLRSALRAAAGDIEPEAGSLDRIRARTTVVRRRRRAVLSAVAAAAVLLPIVAAVTLIDRNGNQDVQVQPPANTGSTEDTTGSTATTDTTGTTTTAPPSLGFTPIFPTTGDLYADPVAAVDAFVRALGFDNAAVGEFQAGGPSDGEVPVSTRNESGAPFRVVSTVSVREAAGSWYVTSVASDDVVIDSYSSAGAGSPADADNPVTVNGKGRGFEATLLVRVLDASGGVLGEAQTMGGGGETLEAFTVDVAYDDSTTSTGMLLLMNTSGAEFATPSFTVVPIGFDVGAATTEVTVFFSDASGSVTAVTRTVPKTVGVLRASLEQLLLGPTDAERANGLASFFSTDDTGDLSVAVAIQGDGTAVVDLDSRLPERIPNASTAAGSQQLLAELNATVFQFPTVSAVEYRLGGSCEAFWAFLQGSCTTISRP